MDRQILQKVKIRITYNFTQKVCGSSPPKHLKAHNISAKAGLTTRVGRARPDLLGICEDVTC